MKHVGINEAKIPREQTRAAWLQAGFATSLRRERRDR
jgi:hypothetical protein